MKWVKDRTSKRLCCQLNTDANYIRFDWVEFMSAEYFRVIDAINECYKKMLEIGKCAEVFRPVGGRQPDILTAKSKAEFQKSKKNIILRYNRYVTTGAPRLSISIDVEIVPDPKKYANSKQPMPTEREILVKEQILEHELQPTTSILSNAMFVWNATSRRMFYPTMRATFAKNAILGKTQITS